MNDGDPVSKIPAMEYPLPGKKRNKLIRESVRVLIQELLGRPPNVNDFVGGNIEEETDSRGGSEEAKIESDGIGYDPGSEED